MEGVGAAMSCVLMAAASGFVVESLLSSGRSRPAIRTRGVSRGTRLVSLLELMGHWVPLVRLGNTPWVRARSERMQKALHGTALAMSWHACVAFGALAVASGCLVGLIISLSLLGAVVGAVGVAVAIGVFVGRRERVAHNAAIGQMPDVLRSLSAALGAGKSLPQAIEHVGLSLDEPLGSEFLRASFGIKGGRTVDEAVEALCARVEVPGMALLGTALQISQRTGSALNELFARTAHMVSDGVGLQRSLEVKTSQARLSARVVAAMPVLLAGSLALLSPDYRAGLALPMGRMCLCVAALLDIIAL